MKELFSDSPSNTASPNTIDSDLKNHVLQILETAKANDIQSLYIGDISSVADLMIVASGTSKRHVQSIAQILVENSKQTNRLILGVEGMESGEWVLVDLGDIIVHLMQPETREFYDLEKLWKVRPSQPEITTPA